MNTDLLADIPDVILGSAWIEYASTNENHIEHAMHIVDIQFPVNSQEKNGNNGILFKKKKKKKKNILHNVFLIVE